MRWLQRFPAASRIRHHLPPSDNRHKRRLHVAICAETADFADYATPGVIPEVWAAALTARFAQAKSPQGVPRLERPGSAHGHCEVPSDACHLPAFCTSRIEPHAARPPAGPPDAARLRRFPSGTAGKDSIRQMYCRFRGWMHAAAAGRRHRPPALLDLARPVRRRRSPSHRLFAAQRTYLSRRAPETGRSAGTGKRGTGGGELRRDGRID